MPLPAVAALVAACAPPQGQAASPTPTLAPTPTPSTNPYDGVAEGAGKGVKLGYLSFGEVVPFVFQISEGIRAQAQLAGSELVECDAKLNAANVSSCMKTLSDAGIKGLIQFQATLADPAVICNESPSGVPVLAVEFDQPLRQDARLRRRPARRPDRRGGRRANGSRRRGTVRTTPTSRSSSTSAAAKSRLRMEGYRQGFLSSTCPITNEQIGPAVDTRKAAASAMTSVLAGLPGKSRIVVVAINGDAALGALDGAATAGRTGDVWVSGQGAEPQVRDAIRNNEHYLGDSAYFPEKYGATIVPAILDLVAGKTVQPLLLIEPAWIDASNIDQYYPQ